MVTAHSAGRNQIALANGIRPAAQRRGKDVLGQQLEQPGRHQ